MEYKLLQFCCIQNNIWLWMVENTYELQLLDMKKSAFTVSRKYIFQAETKLYIC